MTFFKQIYALVSIIPAGKVTTYGEIAKALGTKDARRVGQALHANPDNNKTPCHRVVFSDGRLAPGYAFGGPNEQMRKLQLEGVTFLEDGHVDLRNHLFTISRFLTQRQVICKLKKCYIIHREPYGKAPYS